MENLSEKNNLTVSEMIRNYLEKAAKCGNFLAIVGFIACGLIALSGIILLFYGRAANVLTAIIVTIISYFISNYLFQFSKRVKSALVSDSQEDFEEGIKNLKSLFTFYYYLTIVYLCILAVAIVYFVIFVSRLIPSFE
ncbi:MAG: hypothetical protein LBR10_03545 [Prevotellaceae bacterium]|jgi:ABC-type uncharacterized transport system permease subunit|nr:hypothetical protein [Prevotellaceae bacterium]